jgi:hypothetical protein
LLLAALVLTACSSEPTPEKAAKERERVQSTATSALLLAGAWHDGTAPSVYATHTMEQFSNQLAKAESSAVWAVLPLTTRTTLAQELSSLRTVTATMDTAMRREDRHALDTLRATLISHQQRMSNIPIDTTS